MSSLLLVGGRQKRAETARGDEWTRFAEGVVLRVDTATWEHSIVTTHVSPPDVRPEGDYSVLFKSAWLDGDQLYLCAPTEVLIYNMQSGRVEHQVSLPVFNDLHHVRPSHDGSLWVVSTGLDLLLKIDRSGNILAEINVAESPTWERFDRSVDYRRVATTKPHEVHPNFVFEYKNEVWVTRFEQRDALCVSTPGRHIDLRIERPHDGVVRNDQAYFTTVDGHIVIADLESGVVSDVVDLNTISGIDGPLGWARGLAFLDERRVVVGFSALRVTRFRENLSWVKKWASGGSLGAPTATHISCYDLINKEHLWRYDLSEAPIDAIFSVLL